MYKVLWLIHWKSNMSWNLKGNLPIYVYLHRVDNSILKTRITVTSTLKRACRIENMQFPDYQWVPLVRLRPGPTALADAKVKKNLPSVQKRYASAVYLLRMYFKRSIHPFTVISSGKNVLNCKKLFERMTFTMSIFDIYEQKTVHVRYHSLNLWGILFASSWPPVNLHPLPMKTERARKDKVHWTSIDR